MSDKGLILLIEDNEELNVVNSRALKLREYQVLTAKSLEEARIQLRWHKPDIILLDVMLPDGNGYDFCSEIRNQTDSHIIFLTARVEHEDVIHGLSVGADDYITKPFHPEELLSRIGAVMRRRDIDKGKYQVIRKGTLTLDRVSLQAKIEDKDLMLSPKEFALLLLLMQHSGEVISTEELYEKVWGKFSGESKNAVQTTVSRLRKKLLGTCDITMMRGKGYMLDIN